MNLPRAWNRFWFGPISARPLGLFRIAYGLIALWNLVLLAPEMDVWLSDAGRMRGTEALELATKLRVSPLLWFQDPIAVRLVMGATAVVAVLFTLGWHTRLMGILLYLGTLAIHQRNLLTTSGADALMMITAFHLMLSPSGAAYSIDALRLSRTRGAPAEPIIVPWAQRLIQIQLSVVYFMTAFLKAKGTTWNDGTALHYVLNNAAARRFTLGLTQFPVAINALTFGALLAEFALAFLLWVKAARPMMILAGVALHGGIMLTVNIPVFGELMIASYLTFVTPAELDAAWRRLDPRRWIRLGSRSRPIAKLPRFDGPTPLKGPHSAQVVHVERVEL